MHPVPRLVAAGRARPLFARAAVGPPGANHALGRRGSDAPGVQGKGTPRYCGVSAVRLPVWGGVLGLLPASAELNELLGECNAELRKLNKEPTS